MSRNPQRDPRAAQYVRMSTEHQRYSIEMQSTAIAAFAAANGYEIVRRYADAGKSGLSLKHRDGLKTLLRDVVSGGGFSTVLVYDVSRWGRFQDPDQSAYYEFICKEAGAGVVYIAEPFANDGTVTSSILKNVKRVMAAEYSREISEKTGRTMRALSRRGYWVGGTPPFAYRRQPVTPRGRRRPVLQNGERNGVRGDRVILVPGPPEEIALVQRVFRDFIRGMSELLIARMLNEEGVPAPRGGLWSDKTINGLLRNETYMGSIVRGKRVIRLGVSESRPASEWVHKDNAHEAIIPRETFQIVTANLRRRRGPETDEQMLANLRHLWKRHGYLHRNLIGSDEDVHSRAAYRSRFGSIDKAFELIGYKHTEERAALQVASEDLTRRRGR